MLDDFREVGLEIYGSKWKVVQGIFELEEYLDKGEKKRFFKKLKKLDRMAQRGVVGREELTDMVLNLLVNGQKTDFVGDSLESIGRYVAVDSLYTREMYAQLVYKYDREKGRELFKKIIESYPDNPVVLNNYGYLLAKEKRYAEALPLLEKAYYLAIGDPAIEDSLGFVYLKLGKLDKGLTLIERSTRKMDVGEIEVLEHLVEGYKLFYKRYGEEQLIDRIKNASLSREVLIYLDDRIGVRLAVLLDLHIKAE